MLFTSLHHEDAQLRPARLAPDLQGFIDAHRLHGHRHAALDPLGPARPVDAQALSPRSFGLSPGDVQGLDRRLKAAYCGPLALDASAVRDDARRAWLHAQMEAAPEAAPAGTELLDRLIQVTASASRSKAARRCCRCSMRCWTARPRTASARCSWACRTAAASTCS